jgi:putative ABC transport system permease protein
MGDDSPALQHGRLLRIALRAQHEPSTLATSARQAVAAIDPVLPVTSIATMETQLEESVAPERFSTMVLGAFALSALLLAAIGLYGKLAFTVAQRTREIGVRIALGARPADVIGMVIRQGMWIVFAGLMIGMVAAAGLASAMTGLLYRTKPLDP